MVNFLVIGIAAAAMFITLSTNGQFLDDILYDAQELFITPNKNTPVFYLLTTRANPTPTNVTAANLTA